MHDCDLDLKLYSTEWEELSRSRDLWLQVRERDTWRVGGGEARADLRLSGCCWDREAADLTGLQPRRQCCMEERGRDKPTIIAHIVQCLCKYSGTLLSGHPSTADNHVIMDNFYCPERFSIDVCTLETP